MRILIAEDQDEILELMVDGLTAECHEVITAKDGEEAWEKIQKENPDIILLDLMMPKMNGFEVLTKLRNNLSPTKRQPVIIISALNELQHIKKSFSLEADHYITKPWEMEDIIKGIRLMSKLASQKESDSK